MSMEPYAYCFTDVNGRPTEFCSPPECYVPSEDMRIITPLYKLDSHDESFIDAIEKEVQRAVNCLETDCEHEAILILKGVQLAFRLRRSGI